MIVVIVKEDDYGDIWQFNLKYPDGTTPYDLTGYSAGKMKIWAMGIPGTLVLDKTISITDSASGAVTVDRGSTDLVTPGVYEAEIDMTGSGLKLSTEPFILKIEESGA